MPFSQSLEFDNIPIKAQDFYCIEYYFPFLENILKHFSSKESCVLCKYLLFGLNSKEATNLLGV